MRKNIRNPLFSSYIKKLLPFILFSCVYYNTFYNAEVNYEKAEKIIAQTPVKDLENGKIPSQAQKLLGQAIENSKIVINSYPESKYVDDAYFIIGKASFLRKELFNAEEYLKKLIELYPDSEYRYESQIWLVYTYLKMGNLDLAKIKLNELESSNTNINQFLINTILGEISIEDNDPFKAYKHYNECINVSNDKSQKTSVYFKLLDISKKHNHLDSSIIYLDKLSEYTSGQTRKDIKLDWIKYSREAKQFEDLLIEIDVMLASPEYSSIYIKLELERAKIYLDQSDFVSAKIFLSELSEKYSRKNESAEALYHLGHIALIENFDLELALEYFERSKKDRKSSLYGKRSRDMLNRINEFKILSQEFDYLINEDKFKEATFETMNRQIMPKPKSTRVVTPDSLLFAISEKLLFDFDRLNDAKASYESLITEYADSKFRAQSLYVLNFYFPNEGWDKILQTEYPGSKFNLDAQDEFLKDNIESRRDELWSICDNSYNICAEEFLKLYNERNDNISLYSYAVINDRYLNNIEEAVNSYAEYLLKCSECEYSNEITSRLNEIEDAIFFSIEFTNQKINYYYALESLRLGQDLDSVLVKIDKAIEGSFSKYKSSAQLIKSQINKLISLKDEMVSEQSDSLYKEIEIISEIYNDSFIDDQINYLSSLNEFSTLFLEEGCDGQLYKKEEVPVEDECGICDGPGPDFECWDGSLICSMEVNYRGIQSKKSDSQLQYDCPMTIDCTHPEACNYNGENSDSGCMLEDCGCVFPNTCDCGPPTCPRGVFDTASIENTYDCYELCCTCCDNIDNQCGISAECKYKMLSNTDLSVCEYTDNSSCDNCDTLSVSTFNLKFKDFDRKRIELKDLYKDGPIAVHVFVKASAPSANLNKILEQLHRKYENTNFKIIGLSINSPRETRETRRYVDSLNITFPVLFDHNQIFLRKTGGKVMPYLVFIKSDGSIFERHIGFMSGQEKIIEQDILDIIEAHNNE